MRSRSDTRHTAFEATLLVLIVLIFSICPAAQTIDRSATKNPIRSAGGNLVLLAFSAYWNGTSEPSPATANFSTRDEILGFITSNPGVYLRDVSEGMGLALGDVQYHIWILMRDGLIVDRRDGRYRRFFGTGSYGEMEQKVISALRQGTAGRIVARLAEGRSVSHMQLASMLGITSQAVSWQIRRLKSTGFVETIAGSDGRSYRLTDGALRFAHRYLKGDRVATRASAIEQGGSVVARMQTLDYPPKDTAPASRRLL